MSETTSNITYAVEWREYTLHDVDGQHRDEPASDDSSLGPDFASLADALGESWGELGYIDWRWR